MKKIRKLCIVFSLMFLVCGVSSSVCKAYTWKTLSFNSTGKSFTSREFQSNGDMLLNFSVVNTTAANFGTLIVEKYVDGTWKTAYTSTKSLFVGSGLSTYYGDQVKNCWGCPVRIKFTSTYSVRFSGSIQYFA